MYETPARSINNFNNNQILEQIKNNYNYKNINNFNEQIKNENNINQEIERKKEKYQISGNIAKK